MDLIDRQVAIHAFLTELTKRERKNLLHTWSTVEVKYFVADMLEKIPSAQERKKGKWIEYNYPGAECVYCSKCKEEYYPDDLLLGGNDYPNFCPNCGADMREETEGGS